MRKANEKTVNERAMCDVTSIESSYRSPSSESLDKGLPLVESRVTVVENAPSTLPYFYRKLHIIETTIGRTAASGKPKVQKLSPSPQRIF